MKKIILLLLLLILLIPNQLFAQEFDNLQATDDFSVVAYQDNESFVLEHFNDYDQAKIYFNDVIDNYDNIAILKDQQVLNTHYGIVEFKQNEECSATTYINRNDQSESTINPCDAVDAAFIDYIDDDKVIFKLADNEGIIPLSKVVIHPIETIDYRISSYIVNDDKLYHQIKTKFDSDNFGALIKIGENVEKLTSEIDYYSFDGHYFYTNIKTMLDDYRNNTSINSVNNGFPYFNYYMYLPHRSLTNYTYADLNKYFLENNKITSLMTSYIDCDRDLINDTLNQSQYYGYINSFVEYQYIYGVNALMMLSMSINETNYGRSSLAFSTNNLFNHAAFDNSIERDTSRYLNPASSIYAHAKYYLATNYCNPSKDIYAGSFFGDKGNGINTVYSSDPYWGEKAALYYSQLDDYLGRKDLNYYALGISTDDNIVKVYRTLTDTEDNVLYQSTGKKNFSFILLNKIEENGKIWYKVQSDLIVNKEDDQLKYQYNYDDDIGYVLASDIDVILNSSQIYDDEFVNVTFDAVDGLFRVGSSTVSYPIKINDLPTISAPTKDGYEFVGFNPELKAATKDEKYVAQYKKVDKIEMQKIGQTEYDLNDRINVQNSQIKIYYADESTKIIDVQVDMISNYDLQVVGKQEVIVTYGGNTCSYEINVSSENTEKIDSLQNQIIEIINQYENSTTFTEEDINKIKALKKDLDQYEFPYLNQEQLRIFDQIIYQAIGQEVDYVIANNNVALSVSGLSLNADLTTDQTNKFIHDMYRIDYSDSILNKYLTDATPIINANGYQIISGFGINLTKNNKQFTLKTPIIISLKKPNNSSSEIFTVFYYNDGNLVKCYTRQTDNYIKFMLYDTGNFIIASKDTSNNYQIDDYLENINFTNSNDNVYLFLFEVIIGTYVLIGILVIVYFAIKYNNLAQVINHQRDTAYFQTETNIKLEQKQIETQKKIAVIKDIDHIESSIDSWQKRKEQIRQEVANAEKINENMLKKLYTLDTSTHHPVFEEEFDDEDSKVKKDK